MQLEEAPPGDEDYCEGIVELHRIVNEFPNATMYWIVTRLLKKKIPIRDRADGLFTRCVDILRHHYAITFEDLGTFVLWTEELLSSPILCTQWDEERKDYYLEYALRTPNPPFPLFLGSGETSVPRPLYTYSELPIDEEITRLMESCWSLGRDNDYWTKIPPEDYEIVRRFLKEPTRNEFAAIMLMRRGRIDDWRVERCVKESPVISVLYYLVDGLKLFESRRTPPRMGISREPDDNVTLDILAFLNRTISKWLVRERGPVPNLSLHVSQTLIFLIGYCCDIIFLKHTTCPLP